jgi:hypothetical protein
MTHESPEGDLSMDQQDQPELLESDRREGLHLYSENIDFIFIFEWCIE